MLVLRSPLSGSEFVELEFSLNILVPVVNLNGGGGDASGSLKKKEPAISPNVSPYSLMSETVACAPLVAPRRTIPFEIKPLYLPTTSSLKDSTSIFNTVAEAEYEEGRLFSLLYGFSEYVVVGLEPGPVLWFG